MRKTCLEEIYQLARRDPRVCFFGSDIGSGTLDSFKREMPERFFMEGVCEANIVGIMSGLAMNGKIPFMNTPAVFLTRRCYEQVLLDASWHRLKVRLVGSGAGLVYAPLGATHLAFEEMAVFRAIPNMTIVSPCDAEEMKRLMPQTLDWDGPIYIRLGKGGDPIVSRPDLVFRLGKAILMRTGIDVLLVTTGIMLGPVLEAAKKLDEKGVSAAVLHVHTVKPFDVPAFLAAAGPVRAVLTCEEHSIVGGLGSAVAEILAERAFSPVKKFARLGIPDVFPDKYGSQQKLLEHYGLSAANLAAKALGLLNP